MRSVATLPLIATPSIAHSSLPAGDRRLVELAGCAFEIIPLHRAAAEREQAAWDEYHQREPERPAELEWHIGDPVGYEIEPSDPGSKARAWWCSTAAIEKLRDAPLTKWEFLGTDEEWQRDENHKRGADRRPLSEVAHLWKEVPDPERQLRADELIAALDTWRAATDELWQELDLAALEAKTLELYGQLREVWEEMLTLKATTLEGTRAKAVVLWRSVWSGDDARELLGDTTDAKFIYSLLADLTCQAGALGSARPGRIAVEA